MRSSPSYRLGVVAAVGLAVAPLFAADKEKPEYFTGKVVPLKDVQKDADPKAGVLALAADDGKVYPLSKEDGARMFYTDAALLRRPMRLTGRLAGDPPRLQVLQVHSVIKGELHEVYYWCDICAIKRFEKRLCECCGGPMELREEKVKN